MLESIRKMKEVELIYRDEFGNELYKRFIQRLNGYQVFGKNSQGKLLIESDVFKLAKKGGIKLTKD